MMLSIRQQSHKAKWYQNPWKVFFSAIGVAVVVIVAFVVFTILTAKPAASQSVQTPTESAAMRIADAAQPTVLLMEAAMKCAESKDKDTRKFCLELVKQEVKRGTKVAGKAADATKNSRPFVGNPYDYTYGSVGYYHQVVAPAPAGYRPWRPMPDCKMVAAYAGGC